MTRYVYFSGVIVDMHISISKFRLAPDSEGISAGTEQIRLGSEPSSQPSSPDNEIHRGWVTRETQRKAVLAFCVDYWRTLPEIALALGRTESTVRTKYLRPLLAKDALERRYPESPRHPHQAYRAVKRRG